MSAIYDFFLDLLSDTLPVLELGVLQDLSVVFTFLVVAVMFSVIPMLTQVILKKQKILKWYWIIVIVLSFGLFFKNNFPEVFHVGDDINNVEASKNYNGYFNIQDENAIRLYTSNYTMPNSYYNEYFYSLTYVYNEQSFTIRFNMPYIVTSTYGDDKLANSVVQYFDPFSEDYTLTINYYDGTFTSTSVSNGEDDQVINIYGVSNYEVLP